MGFFMRLPRKKKVMLLLLAACLLLVGLGLSHKRDSRLSCAVALLSEGQAIEAFLKQPGRSFVQAYVYFEPDLPDDVIFGIDQEFVEGVANPLYIKGGDWMALVGLQRTGTVWVATGTEATRAGTPSKDRTWKLLDLGQPLKPGSWYRFRTEADFATREYCSFTVEGPGLSRKFDLKGLELDYPNYIPFSDRAMTFYVFSMRGRSLMAPDAAPDARPIVYFDDVSGGPVSEAGVEKVVFSSSFEEAGEMGEQPVTLPVIQLANYKQGQWYMERAEALVGKRQAPFARSGQHVGYADASLD